MKIKIHVSHEFVSFRANDAFTFGRNVVNLLTTYATSFPSLPYPLTELTAQNTALNDTYAQYQQNGESKKGAYLDAFSQWKIKFSKTADYVDLVADGDEAIINKSGFKPTKSEATPASKIDRLVGLDAVGIRLAGSVHMDANNIAGSGNKGYLYFLAQQAVDIVQNGEQINIYKDNELLLSVYAGTNKMHDFNGLNSMTKYKVRGLGFNPAGMGQLTDGIDVLVQ